MTHKGIAAFSVLSLPRACIPTSKPQQAALCPVQAVNSLSTRTTQHKLVYLLMQQLLEERDAELERTEASLEGHQKGGQAREAVSPAATTSAFPLQDVFDLCAVSCVHTPLLQETASSLNKLEHGVGCTSNDCAHHCTIRVAQPCGTCRGFRQSVHRPLWLSA